MGKRKIPKIVKEIQNFKLPEINYSYQKNISYSQMSMFHECPKKWALRYRDGHKVFSSSIHTVFGTALHEALQHYMDVMFERSGAAADREDIIGIFEDSFRENYIKELKSNNNKHFTTPVEMREFYEDGANIIEFFKKRRSKYFTKRDKYLVGCEVPIIIQPDKKLNNVMYMGYLDLVLYDEWEDKFYIYDIKTSTKGWGDWAKKDEIKHFQLVLYKKFFSEQYGVPLDKIEVEFFIVKRKVPEFSDFAISRIQTFKPASGKVKINKATKFMNSFISEAFNKSGHRDSVHLPKPGNGCRFCPYADNKELCEFGIEF